MRLPHRALIGCEVVRHRRGAPPAQAGARLHVRIVGLFSIVAAMPAMLVAVVASITLDRGLDNWFSTRMRGDRRHLADRRQCLCPGAAVPQHLQGDDAGHGGRSQPSRAALRHDRERFADSHAAWHASRGSAGARCCSRRTATVTDRADITPAPTFPLPPPSRASPTPTSSEAGADRARRDEYHRRGASSCRPMTIAISSSSAVRSQGRANICAQTQADARRLSRRSKATRVGVAGRLRADVSSSSR